MVKADSKKCPAVSAQSAYHVTYRGQVQGVGFRFTVVRLAQEYEQVTGYVKNLSDGDVELWIEGPNADVESLLDDIAAGPHAAYIKSVEAVRAAPSNAYLSFAIRW